jgi:UDP-N-acetylmuramoyl-tripeptide--D-alanyl-D-alanine ligase
MATPIPINQCEFTLAEVVEATGGVLVRAGSSSEIVRGVSIDTRSLAAGALFVALHGVASDGHAYLPQAAARGAAAAIVATDRHHAALDCIEVGDPLDALGRLAHHHLARARTARALPVIAIGGAVGKTTTKELTAAVVRAIFGATLSTPGNLNNLIGVPMTIFTLGGEHRAAVLECGTNTRGEIPRLARIVEPDVATVLNVDLEHSEGRAVLDCAPLCGRIRRRADGHRAGSERSAADHIWQIRRRAGTARRAQRRRALAHPCRAGARDGRSGSRSFHRD